MSELNWRPQTICQSSGLSGDFCLMSVGRAEPHQTQWENNISITWTSPLAFHYNIEPGKLSTLNTLVLGKVELKCINVRHIFLYIYLPFHYQYFNMFYCFCKIFFKFLHSKSPRVRSESHQLPTYAEKFVIENSTVPSII